MASDIDQTVSVLKAAVADEVSKKNAKAKADDTVASATAAATLAASDLATAHDATVAAVNAVKQAADDLANG